MDYPKGLIRYTTENALSGVIHRRPLPVRSCCGRVVVLYSDTGLL